MPDNQEWERHWNTICLGIVTIATAAVGVALFTADVVEIVTSWATYSLVIIAILAYLDVIYLGGNASSQRPADSSGREHPNVTSLVTCTDGSSLNCWLWLDC